jgi:hypothetical protein
MLFSLDPVLAADPTTARVLFLAILALPGTVCGLAGLVDAFCGRRRRALVRGIIAALHAVPLSLLACADVLANHDELHGLRPLILMCWGVVPAVIAFWAVLLAFLVPNKPQRPEQP